MSRRTRRRPKHYREIYEKTKDPRALIGLAEAYVTQNRTDDAIKLMEGELKRDPARSDYRIILGNLRCEGRQVNDWR